MDKKRLDQSIQLHDGRALGFAEYGAIDGFPVIYFTGGNSSRLEGQWFEEAANKKRIRLIVPDRPGFGSSAFHPNRQLTGWPGDVLELANSLSIDKFSVFGLSGGGPHVLATVYKVSDRIEKAAVVSGTAPFEMAGRFRGMWPPVQLIFLTAKHLPSLNRFILKQMSGFYSNKDQMRKRMKQIMPPSDVELFEQRPEVIEIFAQAAKEAHRNGIRGDAWEWQLYVKPWGFNLKEISMEITLWYGLYDRQVPIEMGRYLAKQLPSANLIEVENGGHFSTINNYIEDIFEYLAKKSKSA